MFDYTLRWISVKLTTKYHWISTGTWNFKTYFLPFFFWIKLWTWCNTNSIKACHLPAQKGSTFHRLVNESANSHQFCRREVPLSSQPISETPDCKDTVQNHSATSAVCPHHLLSKGRDWAGNQPTDFSWLWINATSLLHPWNHYEKLENVFLDIQSPYLEEGQFGKVTVKHSSPWL